MPQELVAVDLATIQGRVSAELDAVVDELRRMLLADSPMINEVNEHLLRMRGKLFRPTLLILSAQATGETTA